MRISDWSSDVCSADLQGCRLPALCYVERPSNAVQHVDQIRRARGPADPLPGKAIDLGEGAGDKHVFVARGQLPPADRKSVVLGKSVSVRVDLVVLRTITQKTKLPNYPTTPILN